MSARNNTTVVLRFLDLRIRRPVEAAMSTVGPRVHGKTCMISRMFSDAFRGSLDRETAEPSAEAREHKADETRYLLRCFLYSQRNKLSFSFRVTNVPHPLLVALIAMFSIDHTTHVLLQYKTRTDSSCIMSCICLLREETDRPLLQFSIHFHPRVQTSI